MNTSVRETVQEQLDILIRLQETESQAQALRITLKEVEKREEELARALLPVKGRLEEQEDRLQQLKKQYAGFEEDLRYNEDRLEKSNTMLRAITNNRDYQVLLREMDDNRKVNGRIQEAMLELLDQMTALETEIAALQEKFQEESERIAIEKEVLLASCTRERELLDSLEKENSILKTDTSKKLVSLFEKAVVTGNGIGVAPVRGTTCKGCFMMLPPQFCIELQRNGAIQRCPRCNRIVYWDGE